MSEVTELNSVEYCKFYPYSMQTCPFMNILYMNARSLRNSINDIRNHLLTLNYVIHIIVVVETWLKKEDLPYYDLTEYTAVHSIRDKDKIGGGVSVYVHDLFDIPEVLCDIHRNDDNILVLKLVKHKLNIIAVYRQPNNKNDPVCARFFNDIDMIMSKYKNSYIIGDFNLNLLTTTDVICKYKAIVESNGYVFLNNLSIEFATRVTDNYRSCIDHIISDFIFNENIKHKIFLFDMIADHKSMLISVERMQQIKCKSLDGGGFVELIDHKRIKDEKLIEKIEPKNFQYFINAIKTIINENRIFLPISKKFKKPFMTKSLYSLIKIRNRYFKLKIKYPYWQYVINQYKKYKIIVLSELNEAKRNFYSLYISKNISNQGKLWQTVNQLIFNKDKKTSNYIETLIANGFHITDDEEKAIRFNRFFIDISRSIVENISYDSSRFSCYHSRERYNISIPFYCTQASDDEFNLIIDNLKNSKTTDVYGISNFFVKTHKKALIPKLAVLINKHLFSGIFPDELKVGLVTPIHKASSKADFNNYRPVTVSPIFSKIFEYVIIRRLNAHISNNEILNVNQFGYKEKSNTETAIAHILNEIYNGIDQNYATSLTCIDLSKAFDCLSHNILITKLEKLKLDEFFLNLLKSYLTNRQQAVKVNGKISSFETVYCGTPQGGVLSGLLFNIYVNSIFELNLYGNLFLYCDDCNLVSIENDPKNLKTFIEHDLLLISEWLKFHHLSPNANKTKYILFHNRKKHEYFTVSSLNICFDSHTIERAEHIKILGFIIDETLNFEKHIEYIRSLIVPFTFAIKRIRNFIDDKTALSLYYAYVHSRMVYMSNFWSAANSSLVESVDIVQRKFLRTVFMKDRFCHKNELYSKDILPMSLYSIFIQVVTVFKIQNNMLVNNIKVNTSDMNHSYGTRSRTNYVVQKCRTEKAKSNFFVRSFRLYNDIPNDIKQIYSLKLFKKRYKEFLYEQNKESWG